MAGDSPAAQSLTAVAALFPFTGTPGTDARGNDSSVFRLELSDTVQTLSTNDSPDQGPIKGLLFVPSLAPEDPCNKTVAPFVPQNVTRLRDISQFNCQTIGLAPWISPECTQAFLASSRNAKLQALVFFQPSDGSEGKPPPSVDPSWFLGGADAWKNQNQYPVYAISGPAGAKLMHQLSFYTGNSPNSTVKTSPTQSADVRMVVRINLTHDAEGPNIWGFILAILGSIVVLGVALIVLYQFVQRRRRTDLRRRIETGQVDIEYLGLNQVKVPREVLESMPIYPYPDLSALSDPPSEDTSVPIPVDNPPSDDTNLPPPETETETKDKPQPETIEQCNDSSSSPPPLEEKQPSPDPVTDPDPDPVPTPTTSNDPSTTAPLPPLSSPPPTHQATNRLSHTQTTCAICLDDFIPHSSTVRELPCGHIFHSACIDTFLTQNSCLCPLCKKSVLPPGRYRAPISNIVLRRAGRS